MNGLEALRDIHLPPEPALWSVPEFWLVSFVLAAVAAWSVRHFLRRRCLRAALRALSALEAAHSHNGDVGALARGVSTLLRDYALGCFPNAGVEGMVGTAWLDFLDAHGGAGAFRNGAGAALETLPYCRDGTADIQALLDAVRNWLEANPR